MKILVINAGSSSLKYQLFDMQGEKVLAKGLCERIGIDGVIKHKVGEYSDNHEISFPTHSEAFQEVIRLLVSGDKAVIKSLDEIDAVGHRVVQGGVKFSSSALVTEEMMKAIDDLSELAPLHNPPILNAIKACRAILDPKIPHVGVFDTSFHQTMPPKAYIYPIPYEYYEKYGIRRYGFHGTSHRFVSTRLAKMLGKPIESLKIVSCHLGNGCSLAAINGGKSVDTTMGFTPVAGFTMGTRSGDIDPGIITFLMEKENMCPKDIDNLLNKKSGFLGISGGTSDMRDLVAAYKEGNERAALAITMQAYQIKKYIGAYAAAMGGLDAVIMTGGIGENSNVVRKKILEGLEFLGLELNEAANDVCFGIEQEITTISSKTKAYVVPTNEELLIARDTMEIVVQR